MEKRKGNGGLCAVQSRARLAELQTARHDDVLTPTARRWIGTAFLLRRNKKSLEKADKNVFIIDKPAVSAARPCRNTAGLYIGARVAEARRPGGCGRMMNTFFSASLGTSRSHAMGTRRRPGVVRRHAQHTKKIEGLRPPLAKRPAIGHQASISLSTHATRRSTSASGQGWSKAPSGGRGMPTSMPLFSLTAARRNDQAPGGLSAW